MPLTHFICPDNKTIRVEDCLNKCVHESNRMRCPHISILKNIVNRRRRWTGKPSVTQLIKGTREAYLEIVKDYAVDPDNQVFAEHGTAVHSLIEMDISRIEAFGFTGKPDYFKDGVLVDFKCAGYYKPAMIMGLIKGKDPVEAAFDWAMQLNAYRILIQEGTNTTVKEMYIHVLVRDGGTFMAKKAGITKRTMWLPMKKMEDEVVLEYMTSKKNALFNALKTGYCEKCSQHERWDKDRKCNEFCNVANFCAEMGS